MVASLVSAALAILLALGTRSTSMIFISIPGFAVGGFFALKYATFGKAEQRQEEHKRNRRRRQ
jgi:hypothetical protein